MNYFNTPPKWSRRLTHRILLDIRHLGILTATGDKVCPSRWGMRGTRESSCAAPGVTS